MLPGLALNYMGQGALLVADPAALQSTLYRIFPEPLLVPTLATLAAIIASQAVISGAYSLTQQAMQLGFLSQLTVRYTSASERGHLLRALAATPKRPERGIRVAELHR